MSATGIEAFNNTLQKTHICLNDVMEVLDWEERQKAYLTLRVTLHALRDRGTVGASTQGTERFPAGRFD